MGRVSVAAIGVAAFLAAAVYFAPAGVAASLVGDRGPARLGSIEGRLWDGRASLFLEGRPAGQLRWSFDPTGLLDGGLRFRWRIVDPGYDLEGHAQVGWRTREIEASGRVGPILIERVLAPYRIAAGGVLDIAALSMVVSDAEERPAIRGKASWTGGPVGYRIAGRPHEARLPRLEADIETVGGEPVLLAHAAGEAVPLLRLRLDAEGWAHIGITQRFTELVGMPWPGDGPVDAFVLEVGEKIL